MQSILYIVPSVRKALSPVRYYLPYQIDRMLSSRIDPADTLIVSGFWRSGTTWLQESLAELIKAKTVFEPFHPLVAATREIYSYNQLSTKDAEFLELYMPYWGASTLNGHPLHEYFDKALRSEIPGKPVRVLRKGLTESFRPRVILKLIRGSLCLRTAQNTFSMPVIHIYRDPRAIVASLKWTDWDWLFDHLCLREQLLEPQDGRAEFFGNWSDEIRAYDKEGRVARITAYWALTEIFIQYCYADDHQARISFVSYEELCRKREDILLDVFEKLDLCHDLYKASPVLDIDSFTTMKLRQGISLEQRISGWQKKLSNSEITTIESIVRHFGFDDRLVNGE